MIYRLVYNNKLFKIIGNYSNKFSSNEVTFSDIEIDFTDRTLADIPYKYQEVKIIRAETEEEILTNGFVIFTGFVDDIKLSTMKNKKEERELTLTLLSPLKIATKRTVSLIGTFKIKTAIERVLQPLIDDGFVIKEINIPDGQITTNFVLETVENCMNTIGYKRNIFWNIDEQKNIYVNNIDYLFGLPIKKTITNDFEEQKKEGLIKLQPTIENINYANVLNFKNVRLYYSTYIYYDYNENRITAVDEFPFINLPRKLKKGDTVEFAYPIVVDENTARMLWTDDEERFEYQVVCLSLSTYIPTTTTYKTYSIYLMTDKNNSKYNTFVTEGDITYSDAANENGEEGTLVLQRDSFFDNLITGFKYNGDDEVYVLDALTNTGLRYTTMKFMYSEEINKLKGIISESGQIENTIDYKSGWTTINQLNDYARSLMVQNSNIVNTVELEYDKKPDLIIGDIVEIQVPELYIEGKFAVKNIDYNYINDEDQTWNITLKNADLNSTYIDLFRPTELQQNENTIDTVILSEFIEETINETHTIEESEA